MEGHFSKRKAVRGRIGAAVAAVLGFASLSVPAAAQMTEEQIRERADALVGQMTPEEKAAQLTTLFALPAMQQLVDRGAASGTGSFLFVSDPIEANRLQRLAVEESRLGIPLLFGFDVFHGLSTVFPVPIGMAASWDTDLVERSQAIAAAEARAVGIQWTFAPMIDIARDPRWGRIVEGAGEDPFLGSTMAAAQVRGFQGAEIGTPGRIIAGPKHFVGYGAALGGRDYDEVDLSDNELWNTYLPPFQAAIDAGAGNVMTAYMGLNGIPAAGNRWLLTDLLREEMGFDGWVVSDAEGVKNLQTHGVATSPQAASVQALQSGTDMEMALYQPAMANLPAALQAGQIDQARVDEAVRRVLEAKLRLGLFENPYVDEERSVDVLRAPAHLDAAREAAERSAVLLRNEGNLLPLDRSALRTVAVIGPLADAPRDILGPWVFPQNDPAQQSILDGIRVELGSNVTVSHEPGVGLPQRLHPSPFETIVGTLERPTPSGDETGIREAVAQAEAADVAVLVLGEGQDMIGEAASRSSLELPGRQQELLEAVIATGKPVVLILINGRPLDLQGAEPDAILELWYPGSRGGEAAANLLFGDAVPGGKLPFTWPRNVGQVPLIYSNLPSHHPDTANQRYWNEPNDPAYPFGFGLSYSTFEYANVQVDRAAIQRGGTVRVTFDLENTGSRRADEVAQLYVHQTTGTASRPVRLLKGFQRVTLEPGETRRLSFEIGPEELRYWNAAARDWVLDESTYEVAVGGDSTAPFQTSFVVSDGNDAANGVVDQ